MTRNYRRIISLGRNCQPYFNARRHVLPRLGCAEKNGLGAPNCIFSWQVTPTAALLEYFRRDFDGLFEIDDLIFEGPSVSHRHLKTLHPHEFSEGASPEQRRSEYPSARERHNHLCRKTRLLLADNEPTLFVLAGPLAPTDRARIEAEIRARNRRRRFDIAVLADAAALAPTDPERPWQGNLPAWDTLLGAYETRPDRPMPLPVFRKAKANVAAQASRLLGHVRAMRF